ncbi:hypothetical protein D3C71_1936270 [compost metagenome]
MKLVRLEEEKHSSYNLKGLPVYHYGPLTFMHQHKFAHLMPVVIPLEMIGQPDPVIPEQGPLLDINRFEQLIHYASTGG